MDFYCDQVLSGKTVVEKIVETANVLAFHHIVVIPKRHIASLASFEAEDMPTIQEMLAVAADLCRQVTEEHGGCRLSTNSGDYQTTKHLHFYIHHGDRLRDEHGKPLNAS